jgi:hypothetical protein
MILLATYRVKSETRILSNTRSLLFFGVCHRGMSPGVTSYVNIMPRMIRFLFPSDIHVSGGKLLPSSDELRTLLEGFAPISDRFQIYTFCDKLPTTTQRRAGCGNPMTYYMGLPNEELLYINAGYTDMIKFSSPESAGYQNVLAILERILINHDGNWRSDQLFRLVGVER